SRLDGTSSSIGETEASSIKTRDLSRVQTGRLGDNGWRTVRQSRCSGLTMLNLTSPRASFSSRCVSLEADVVVRMPCEWWKAFICLYIS
ncbi:hypothetical protein Tco_1470302, partial [Tanacetum coccineum]